MDINHWSYAELNVPAYSSDKVDRAAGRVLCEFAENPMDVRLEVTAPPRIFFSNAPQTTSVDCGELTPLTGR